MSHQGLKHLCKGAKVVQQQLYPQRLTTRMPPYHLHLKMHVMHPLIMLLHQIQVEIMIIDAVKCNLMELL